MKKGTIITAMVAASLIVVGGGTAFFASAMGAGDVGLQWNLYSGYSRTAYGGREVLTGSAEPGEFRAITVQADLADIRLIPSDRYAVEYAYYKDQPEPTCTVEDGQLIVRARYSERSTNGMNFHLFNFNLPRWNGWNFEDWDDDEMNSPSVRIYFPADLKLDTVSVNTGAGEVEAENLNVTGDFSINAQLGDVELSRVNAKTLTLDLSAGSCDLSTIQADQVELSSALGSVECDNLKTKSFDVNCSAGSIEVQDSTLGDTVITNDLGSVELEKVSTGALTIDSSSGSILAKGTFAGDVDLSCDLGGIEMRNSLARSQFNLDLSVSLGELRVDGQKYANSTSTNDGAPYDMKVRNNSGGVEIQFGK